MQSSTIVQQLTPALRRQETYFFFCWDLLDLIQPHCGQLDRVKVSMLLCTSQIGDNFYIQITNSTKETLHTEQSKNVINQLATLKLHLLYLLLKS